MFLETYAKGDILSNIQKFGRESSTYNMFYLYWRDQLFERVMRLFIWETGDDVVMPKEIEQRLIIQGHCGISKFEGEVTAFYGNFYGVTKYIDEFPNYMVRCPIYSGSKEIGKDIVVINNNSLRNPVLPLIHHYAILLAHAEVTLNTLMINARDTGGVPIVSTQKQKQSVADYQGRIFNGQYGTVTDIGNLGIQYAGADRHTNQDVMTVMEAREKLLKSFYSDIGVRSAFEKRNNTVRAEVEADTSLLLLNLADMLKSRKDGAEKVNSMYGTNWSVHIAEEIDYGAENQRVQFDTGSVTHQETDERDDVVQTDSGIKERDI